MSRKAASASAISESGDWVSEHQLGESGKEGQVFLVRSKTDPERVGAMKQFKRTKALSTFRKEVQMQTEAAELGLSPAVLEVFPSAPPRFVMEKMDGTVMDVLQAQGGTLTDKQQRDIFELYSGLDSAGILHNDPNPLNLMMRKQAPHGSRDGNEEWLVVDFGFSKRTDPKKHSHMVNVEGLEMLLYGGYQGLMPRGLLRERCVIIDEEIENLRDSAAVAGAGAAACTGAGAGAGGGTAVPSRRSKSSATRVRRADKPKPSIANVGDTPSTNDNDVNLNSDISEASTSAPDSNPISDRIQSACARGLMFAGAIGVGFACARWA